MPEAVISLRHTIAPTPRVLQIEGLFDLPAARQAEQQWRVQLPLESSPWNVGLIVGPSGSGKTTIARHFWPDALADRPAWPMDRSVVDGFPAEMSIKEITGLLCAVGFASPPAWRRPFHTLSTGEQFRAGLARRLAENPELAVVDEFTSAVDRTTARVGSCALARTVRARGQKLIAITCHEDVEPWLDPDWRFLPDHNAFSWRRLRRRPQIELVIRRVGPEAWQLFRAHHYLSNELAPGTVCLGGWWENRLVAFSAWIQALTARGGKREHRTVTLPDCQGVGIGAALSDFAAALWKAAGFRVTSTTAHPGVIARRQRSTNWLMHRRPSLTVPERGAGRRLPHASARLTAGFEYIGPALDSAIAHALLDSASWNCVRRART